MSKEVIVQNPGNDKALQVFNSEFNLELVQTAIAENVGVGGITEFDFERIKIPSGGGTTFSVATLEGEKEEKTVTGVIILARDARAYWARSLDEGDGNQPPDCHSNNGLVGIGAPGGNCAQCQLAQFGSAKKGKGQACKAIRQLFLLDGNSMLPVVVALPPTSLKPAKQYMLRLAGQGVPYWTALTKIGLETTKNDGGIKYSKATFTFAGRLSKDDAAKAKQYSDMLRPLIERMTVDQSQFNRQEGS